VSSCPEGTKLEGEECVALKTTNIAIIVIAVLAGISGIVAILLLYRFSTAKKLSKIHAAESAKIHIRKSLRSVKTPE